jgi:phosphoglycerate dehydrogenase-like enzyme
MFRKRSEGRFEVVSIKTLEEMDSVKNAAYFVARGIPFKKTEIDQLGDGVKLIHRWGVGYDSVDIETAGKRGIVVAICAGGNAQPVAEMAVLLMLASYRRLLKQVQRAKDGRSDKDDIATESYLLQGKKVGIVGFGNIGRRVCKIVQGFGATVQYFDFFRPDTQTEKELHAEFVPFDELVKTSDIITVHAPLTDQTRGMFGAREFAMMKNSAMFVNTARGGLADTGSAQPPGTAP